MRILCLLIYISVTFSSTCFCTTEEANVRETEFTKTRKKRELDEEDVINRFEMERVSPLYDVFRQIPPFEEDWSISSTDFTFDFPSPQYTPKNTSEFKFSVSKDKEHVVSESGRRFRENSALNWFYNLESYSNETSVTNGAARLDNSIQDKAIVTRKQDEDHVISQVPGLRTGRGFALAASVHGAPTTARATSPVDVKEVSEAKPNITTRYILLQSGRIVAINVTSVASVYKSTSGSSSSGRNPALPPVYFGSRIRKNSTARVDSNSDKNKITDVLSPLLKTPLPKSLPTTKPEVDTKKTHTTNYKFVTTQRPVTKPFIIKPAIIIPAKSTVFVTPTPATTRQPRDWTITTKLPTTRVPLRSAALIDGLKANTRSIVAEVFREKSQVTTPPMSLSQLINFASPSSPSPKHKFQTTTRTTPKVPTRVPITFLKERTTFSPMPFRTSRKQEILEKERTTALPTTRFRTFPPRNIIETIYDVLHQPGTSEIPFLVITFDSLKRNMTLVTETSPDEFTTRKHAKDRSRKFQFSKVEYETLNLPKAKLLHYNYDPPQRNLALSNMDLTTKQMFTPLTTRRGFNNLDFPTTLSAFQTSQITAVDEYANSPNPTTRTKHEFIRLVPLVSSTIPSTSVVPSTAKTQETRTRVPRYRGFSHVAVPPRKYESVSISTTPFISSTSQSLPAVTNRRPRHQQGFHLRNSVGFQTVPPGSFTDRRSYSKLTTPVSLFEEDTSKPVLEKNIEKDGLVFRFEPTRKNPRLSAHQVTPTAVTSVSSVTPSPRNSRAQINTARAINTENSRIAPPTTASRNSETKFEARTRPPTISRTTPMKQINRSERNFRFSSPQPITEQYNPSSTSVSTAKPFRVYYFEPKRKRTKKINGSTIETRRDAENRFSNQIPTKSPVVRSRINNTPNRIQAPTNVPDRVSSPKPTERSVSTQRSFRGHVAADIPGRRGRARFIENPSTSPADISTATSSTTTRKPKKKPWYSPFIRHQPNVGLATLSPTRDNKVTGVSPVAFSAVAPSTTPETFPLPPDNSFQDVLFRRIRRIN